jgi:hypothetical protein
MTTILPPDEPEPWHRSRGARDRVRAQVAQVVSDELARTNAMQADIKERERQRLRRHASMFDPPQDAAALSERLHLPYTRKTEEPVNQTMADEVEEDEIAPDPDEGSHGD